MSTMGYLLEEGGLKAAPVPRAGNLATFRNPQTSVDLWAYPGLYGDFITYDTFRPYFTFRIWKANNGINGYVHYDSPIRGKIGH